MGELKSLPTPPPAHSPRKKTPAFKILPTWRKQKVGRKQGICPFLSSFSPILQGPPFPAFSLSLSRGKKSLKILKINSGTMDQVPFSVLYSIQVFFFLDSNLKLAASESLRFFFFFSMLSNLPRKILLHIELWRVSPTCQSRKSKNPPRDSIYVIEITHRSSQVRRCGPA